MGGSCGVGGWGGPLPGDPSNDVILTAVPAFGGIDLSWNAPSVNPWAVAYCKLFRGLASNFATAIELPHIAGGFYYDKIDSNQQYFYWIQLVSVHGTHGSVIGPASATARPTIVGLLDLLSGEIDTGLLATSLRNELDKISILNTNLLSEITDRENGETTLANALADVAAGVAAAHTFILDEINTRTTENSALAESIDGLVLTVGDGMVAVVETMRADLDALTGEAHAMWTAQVTVDGLIGGFGVINDGLTVEAGFDVDRFWIGRTSADKRKPFIVDDGVVYIDEAAINKLSFSKLRSSDGSFIVSGDRLKIGYAATGTINSELVPSISAAQSDATAANTALADIASDNKLTPGEKPVVVREYADILAEQTDITAKATTYGITTEKAAYTTAISALTTYLSTLSGWNTIPGSTVTIVGSTFRSKFSDVYLKRQLLLNKIYALADTRINSAAAIAAAAQTSADAAILDLTAISADAILSKVEKLAAQPLYTSIVNERPGIIAQADAYGISYAAYTASVSALATYLSTIPGGWNTTTVDSPIIRATWDSKWSTVYVAKSDLLNAIAAAAGTLATWSGVSGSGKPANNATVGASFGVNIGGQITSGNINTYIAGAAIGLAHINVASIGSLSAITANMGTITAGTITLNTSGHIKGGQTGWDVGDGFFLGYSGGDYKFSIGNGTQGMTWDGTYLRIRAASFIGAITLSTTGHIKGGQSDYNTGSGFFLGYSGSAYKFSIGNPSGYHMLWTGTDLIVNAKSLGLPAFSASIGGGALNVAVSNGTKAYGTRTVTPSGGTAPYTYRWTLLNVLCDGAGYMFVASGAATATGSFSGNNTNAINTAVAQCMVTDAIGRVASAYVNISATHGTPI